MYGRPIAAAVLALLALDLTATAAARAEDKKGPTWLDLAATQAGNAQGSKDWLKSYIDGFKAAAEAAMAQAAETASDDEMADSEDDMPCNSAADGEAGHNNSGPNSGNGGKGGTVTIDKSAAGGCASANGGKGGSFNWSWGQNNSVSGNGGNGGTVKIR